MKLNNILISGSEQKKLDEIRDIIKCDIYNILTLDNIDDISEIFIKHHPDIILILMNNSPSKSIELMNKIKELSSIRLPFIFIGEYNPINIKAVFKAGGNDFIQLPINESEAKARIDAQLDFQQLLRSSEVENTVVETGTKRFTDDHSSIADLVWETDLNWNFTFVSSNVEKIFGYKPEDFIGKKVNSTMFSIPPEKFDDLVAHVELPLRNVETAHHGKNGDVIYFISTILPIEDDQGQLVGYRGLNNDITERKISEQEIIELNEHLEELVARRTLELETEKDLLTQLTNNLPGIFFTFDKDGFIDRSNNNFSKLVGKNGNEIKHLNIKDRFPELGKDDFEDIKYKLTHKGTITFESSIYDKDGKTIPFNFTGSITSIYGKKMVVAVGINNSEKYEIVQELKWLYQAVEQSPVSIVITDKEANILYVNNNFTNVTGFTSLEVLGQNPRILQSGIMTKEFFIEMWEVLKSGQVWRGEIYNKKKNGEIFCEKTTISPVFNERGEVNSYVAVKEDITRHKNREKLLREETERLNLHSRYIQELTQGGDISETDQEVAFKTINKFASLGLGNIRSSIWIYSKGKNSLTCVSSYNNSNGSFDNFTIDKSDYPQYFELLSREDIVTVTDTSNDYRVSEFKDSYFKDHQVSSFMDIMVWLRGSRYGILRIEDFVENRHWKSDEKSYGKSLADFVSLAVEANDRRKEQKRAEEAAKAKSDFIANLSHEIRTPMNAVIGLIHLLGNTELSELQQGYIERINSASNTLLGIITDILDFSKIESGKMELENVQFELKDTVNSIVELLKPKIENKGLICSVKFDDDLPDRLLGDSLKVGQVLLNFLSNAFKFTEKGEISIHCGVDIIINTTAIIKISIKDTGIGLSEEDKNKLFKSFSQADSSTTRKYGGTGLGLSISKSLTELMDGNIEVESEPGKGSTFSFTFSSKIVKESRHIEVLPVETENIKKVKQKKLHILIAEDNEINQELMIDLLEDIDIKVDVADNGEKAVEMAKKGNYDLILMDLQMPILDGFEATRFIREMYGKDELPIIALTGNAIYEIRNEVLEAGMNDYVTKPISIETLFQKIEDWSNKNKSDNISEIDEDEINITHINAKEGLLRFNNDIEVYINIIIKFKNNHRKDFETIMNLYNAGQYEKSLSLIHNLKGVSGNISADEVYKICRNLEEAIGKRDFSLIDKLLETLSVSLESLFKSIEEYELANSVNPVKSNRKIASLDDIRTELDSVAESLKSYNTEAKRILSDIIPGVINNELKSELMEVFENVGNYDFDNAYKVLNRLLNK